MSGVQGVAEPDVASSVGVFWGSDDHPIKRSSQCMPLISCKTSVCAQRSKRQRPRPITLPSVVAVTNNISIWEAGATASSAQSLLGVLQAMLRSIQKDMEYFQRNNHALDMHGTKSLNTKYYPSGVEKEDPDYFIREREMLANRAALDANVHTLFLLTSRSSVALCLNYR